MIPYYSDEWLTVYAGDCRDVLAGLPSDSVDCVVTSPPYWGLRDYGSEGQLGLERTPEEYVANMVAVFREVRRVLKPSGTCWLNLGDSYANSSPMGRAGEKMQGARKALFGDEYDPSKTKHGTPASGSGEPMHGLKPKDLVGIPWRVAFALQADGWYLRSDIIWSKSNPMPESVTDRPTKAHEYLFLLTKSARYYFDADAVREAHVRTWDESNVGPNNWVNNPAMRQHKLRSGDDEGGGHDGLGRTLPNPAGRNIRSVWSIATRPYPGAHFAVFPPELPERCIKAGSPIDGTILDPFGGSGTVGMVANRLSRRAILIDLNPEYLKQQMARNAQTPLGLPA